MTAVLAGVALGISVISFTLLLALSIRIAKLEQRMDWHEQR